MENDEEGWSPEKDKAQDDLLKLGKKLMEQGGLLAKKQGPKSFSEMASLLKQAWEECRSFKSEMVRLGEPLTWRGQRILTAHEAAQATFLYGPEPG